MSSAYNRNKPPIKSVGVYTQMVFGTENVAIVGLRIFSIRVQEKRAQLQFSRHLSISDCQAIVTKIWATFSTVQMILNINNKRHF